MTTYQLPPEPAGDTLWTTDQETGEAVEWRRYTGCNPGSAGWCRPGVDAFGYRPWANLLDLGPVYDTHPNLAGIPPLPWVHAGAGVIVDREGHSFNERDDEVCALIVRAVNAYAERYQGGPS